MTASAPAPTTAAKGLSAWAPLAIPAFRILWIAQLGSNIGTWMQTVGAQWYLVEAAAGATLIALVQTASLAPSLLLSLPSGVLADVLDRRRLLIWGSVASAVLAAILTVVSAVGELTPLFVLAITFLLGVTSTLTSPAWQAIQPELVPREMIGASSALGGAAVNGARAVGPALAGVVLSLLGTPVVFALNAISFVGAVIALIAWKRPPQEGLDDRERFIPALRAGVRYVVSARLVRRILLRSALFAAPAGALWALLPLTATQMGLDSTGYGVLLGALGVGAVLGIVLLPMVRKRIHDSPVLAISAVLFGLGTAGAAVLPFWAALPVLLLAGLAWIGTLTVLNANLQLTLPQWALLAAAALLMIVGVSVRFLPLLPGTGAIDRSAATAWATPTLQVEPEPTDGPILVEVVYRVPQAQMADFLAATRMLAGSRRRTGAYRWRVYRSLEDGDAMLESFLVPSWSEYRRQRTQRLTGRDREMEQSVRALLADDPVERHYLAASSGSAAAPPGGV